MAMHPSVLNSANLRRNTWKPQQRTLPFGRLQTHATSVSAKPSLNRLELALPTEDTKTALRFAVVNEGRGEALEVISVRPGSAAYLAGVRVGARLRAISDPVRYSEVHQMGDRPSLRYVQDALQLRRSDTVELAFDVPAVVDEPKQQDTDSLLTAVTQAAEKTISNNSTTVAEQLAARYAERLQTDSRGVDGTEYFRLTSSMDDPDGDGLAAEVPVKVPTTDVQRRMKRRQDYMEQVGQRNDGPFFALVGAAFLLPAVVILAVAYSTGYLDKLYSISMHSG